MTSLLAAQSDLLGAQRPRVCWVPDFASTSGEEAIEVCELAGFRLDPWQAFVLTNALGEREDGQWAAFEVGVTVSRQNGKGGVLEARELAGLFVLGERLIVHSAHQFDTSLEAFRRLMDLIESAPDLERMVKRVVRSHGEEGIELKTGQRIRFRTRTKGGGRGFSGDCLILDEAMILPTTAHGTLLPTLSARPNPQVWYTGSAVDQEVHEHGVVFSKVRQRGIRGGDPALAYFEWSLAEDLANVDEALALDPRSWAQANPGLGIRISSEYVGNEQRSLDPRTFAVERLGVGDWHDPRADAGDGISIEAWNACEDKDSIALDPVCIAFDVRPNRSAAAIGVAGLRGDDLLHVEVVEHRPGTGWVAERLAELVEDHRPVAVVCDKRSPAASLLQRLSDLGVEVKTLGPQDHADGCGLIFDAVEQDTLRHLGSPELTAAVRGAVKRPLGDAWAWSRRNSSVDISPLVACTLALWGFTGAVEDAPFVFEVLG